MFSLQLITHHLFRHFALKCLALIKITFSSGVQSNNYWIVLSSISWRCSARNHTAHLVGGTQISTVMSFFPLEGHKTCCTGIQLGITQVVRQCQRYSLAVEFLLWSEFHFSWSECSASRIQLGICTCIVLATNPKNIKNKLVEFSTKGLPPSPHPPPGYWKKNGKKLVLKCFLDHFKCLIFFLLGENGPIADSPPSVENFTFFGTPFLSLSLLLLYQRPLTVQNNA